MEFMRFIFSSFWHFAGFFILLSGLGAFVYRCWNRLLRHRMLLKHGYPPPHCNADGELYGHDHTT